MIEKLTKQQEEQIAAYRDKWVKIGHSCEPTNFEECKKWAILAYEKAGLSPPKDFYLVDSPASAVEKIKELDCNRDKSRIISEMSYGSHDASWLSFYDYMLEVLNIKECEDLVPLIEIAKNCGWWSPYDDVVVFQNRHCELHLNDEGEIHNEKGPAILYLDGYSVWAINGKRVTEQIVMSPDTLTINEINKEEDQDLRAIMIDRYGWPKYIEETKAKCIDYNHNVIENSKEALYESEFGNRLVVTCPTGRVFAIGVPDSVKSCEEAQTWLGNEQSEEKINVIART